MADRFHSTVQSNIFNTAPNIVIAGEVNCAIRATGDVLATGLEPTGVGMAIPDGKYREIPSVNIGIMSYGELSSALGYFVEPTCSGLEFADTGKHPWNSVGAVGLDGLFSPYTTAYKTGEFLPHFEEPTSTAVGTSKTLNPFDPFNILDTSVGFIQPEHWYDSGHNITMAMAGNPLERGRFYGGNAIYPSGSGMPIDMVFEKDNFVRHKTEVSGIRSVGFRSPMILSGWGYDTDGNPVPSSGGKIHPEATWNPAIWKTGPVDLRWDDARKVWTGGGGGGTTTIHYLCKVTNTYNPTSFSFEVDRSRTRDQYTRNAPTIRRPFSATDAIYDPEYVAYYENSDNAGQYESLDYSDVEFPFYEAFVIRDTSATTSPTTNASDYYNIWTEDCQDCGVVQNPCAASGSAGAHSGVSTNRKILIENPLRQALDTGDLCFTIDTGRTKKVNTGSFSGGSGVGAIANLVVGPEGSGAVQVVASGSGYAAGGFSLSSGCDICANVTLYFEERTGTAGSNPSGLALASGTVDPSSGFKSTGTCPLQIIPSNATADTETLPIHWIQQAEFKSQQIVTHVECGGGVLQACTMKIQTQGFKTCEHCGEDTAFINAY